MRYRDLCDQEPEPEHPAKRQHPAHIASLYIYVAEHDEFQRIRKAHGAEQIVGVRKVPVLPAHDIDVLCKDAEAAVALSVAWREFCETSPHRPRTQMEREEWGLKVLPEFANIPKDWTF